MLITGHPKDEAMLLGYYDAAFPDGEFPFHLHLYKDYRAWYYLAGYSKGRSDRMIRMWKCGGKY